MKKQLTEPAQVAKIIKQELTKRGFKVKSARSRSYTGGNAVDIKIEGWYSDSVMQKINADFAKYQAGNVDPYQDMYVYKSGKKEDIPQTKYLFIECDSPSDDDYETIRKYCLNNRLDGDTKESIESLYPWDLLRRFRTFNWDVAIEKFAKENNLPWGYKKGI